MLGYTPGLSIADKGVALTLADAATGRIAIPAAGEDVYIPFQFHDLGTAGQIAVAMPDEGEVISVMTALDTALTVGDAVLTIKNASGTMGTLTLTQSGSAVGDVDELTPTGISYAAVSEGDYIEIETDGGCNAGESATGLIVLRRYGTGARGTRHVLLTCTSIDATPVEFSFRPGSSTVTTVDTEDAKLNQWNFMILCVAGQTHISFKNTSGASATVYVTPLENQ